MCGVENAAMVSQTESKVVIFMLINQGPSNIYKSLGSFDLVLMSLIFRCLFLQMVPLIV